MSEEAKADFFETRIVKFEYVDADTLTPYPLNPRRHPKKQREAVKAMLDEFGWLAPLTVNINNGYIFDGEERAWQATQQNGKVPVIFVDISEDEHARAIQYFDETGAMAIYDVERLRQLREQTGPETDERFKALAEYVRAQALEDKKYNEIPEEWPEYDESVEGEVEYLTCPHCGEQFPK